MKHITLKPLRFIGSSLKDLKTFPDLVKKRMGRALQYVQNGRTPVAAKPLKGLPDVMEIVSRYDKDTYRGVYVADIGGVVYVLHCFKKKSKQGIKTPNQDVNLIRRRLRQVQEENKEQ